MESREGRQGHFVRFVQVEQVDHGGKRFDRHGKSLCRVRVAPEVECAAAALGGAEDAQGIFSTRPAGLRAVVGVELNPAPARRGFGEYPFELRVGQECEYVAVAAPLDQAAREVRDLLSERAKTKGEYVKSEMKDARRATDVAVADLYKMLMAMQELLPTDELTALVSQLKGVEIYARQYYIDKPAKSDEEETKTEN